MFDDVVELPDGALALDLGLKARRGLASVALEGGDRGVLVLDFAGDGAERPIGDVPGDRAAELARAEMPRPLVRPLGHSRRARAAACAVEMIAELVEGAHDLAGEVVFGGAASLEHDPEAVDAAPGARRAGQLLQDGDGAADGCDRDPVLRPAGSARQLVGGAVDAVTLDEPVGAACDCVAAGLHRLHLAVTHTGQIGANDVAGRLQPLLLIGERLLVKAMRSPGLAGVAIAGQCGVHAADLRAEIAHGFEHTRMVASDLADLGRLAPDMERDQRVVDRDGIEPAADMRVSGPDGNAAPDLLQVSDIHLEPLLYRHAYGLCATGFVDVDLDGSRAEPVKFCPGGEDIGREIVDVAQRPVEHCGDHRLRDARRAVLTGERRAAGNLKGSASAPGRESKAALAEAIRMFVEVNGDIDQRRDLEACTGAARLQVCEPGVEIALVERAKIEGAPAECRESHETAQTVEHGPHGGRSETWPRTTFGLMQAGVEVFLGREKLHGVSKLGEIDAAMTPPGVLPEYSGCDVPEILAKQGQGGLGNARADCQAIQHAIVILNIPRGWWRDGGCDACAGFGHAADASGGRQSKPAWLAAMLCAAATTAGGNAGRICSAMRRCARPNLAAQSVA